ncbi:putative cysteine-rich receptor-like protein kinase 35 [Vitis vinifera]|nr:putative cysteine-rich receptor-like protein kinase 35 [Vitis vinifera]
MAARIVSFLLFFLAFGLPYSHGETWIKAGYWYAGSESPIPDIKSGLFTHLLCAFADINPTTYQLSISTSEEHYFSTFTDIVKRRNPSVVTLLSIWGRKGPTGLSILGERVNSSMVSLMVRQPSYRKSFIESAMKTARLYGFHGLDLFWLWPNTESDMKNMGALLDELRAAVKLESRNSGKAPLILTMAVHYVPTLYSVSYHIEAIQRNLDWAHIPAYDYYLPSRVNFTHAHAALYDPLSNVSTDFGIREWISKGFPASKLVLGLPYHGYAWTLVNPNHNGIGAPASGIAMTADGSMSYKYIKWFLRSYGATSMYNATYVVNYVTIGTTWIGFDDVQAIRAKISYAKEKKLLGYNVFQVSNDDNWALSQAAQDDDKDHHKKQELLVKILVPIAVLNLVAGSIMCCYSRSRVLKAIGTRNLGKISLHEVGSKSSGVENFNSNAPNLRVFSFAEIKEATNNFSFENKLGEGGFGPVYKGKSQKGEEMAVKRLSKTSNQGAEEFINEVTLTAKLQHVNLVRLQGFCTEGEEKMLIYEYMPNKSLDFYLFDLTRRYFLDWTKRIAIIEGIIQGLLYLQEYSNFTIIHRDLKASNILLDSEMKPKISDFGIARAFQKDEHEASTGRIVGTYGYVPPEYVRRGIYSMKYDVYSFGVLLLQIISSRRNSCTYGLSQNLNLLEYAYELWKEGEGMRFMDPSLDDSSSSCKLMACMQVALLCIQENPDHRPTMLEVSSMLKSETAAMPAPLRPAFSIKSNEDKLSVNDATTSSQQNILSVNDATISDLVPR